MKLYGRQDELQRAQQALRRDDRIGVWVRGSQDAELAEFVQTLADGYIADVSSARDRSCVPIHFDASRMPKPDRTYDHYQTWLSETSLYTPSDRCLPILAHLDAFPEKEQDKVITFLTERSSEKRWKAIVSATPTSRPAVQSNQWTRVDLNKRLTESQVQAYVGDYLADHHEETRLASLQDPQQLAEIHRRTGGLIDALQSLLEEMRWSAEEIPVLLSRYESASSDADPIREGAKRALQDLNPAHCRVLKALSLATAPVRRALLDHVLPDLREEIDALIAQLAHRSLVECQEKSGFTRYALPDEKRAVIRAGCAAVEVPFDVFLAWWQDYVRQNQANPALLAAEHANLLGLSDQLWLRTGIPTQEPRPTDAFEMIPAEEEGRRQAAKDCIELHDQLYVAWQRQGLWLDCRRSAARAYAAAHSLPIPESALRAAYHAALVCVQEGSCSPQDLEYASEWVERMADQCEAAGHLDTWSRFVAYIEKPSPTTCAAGTWLGLVARMRGVIAMRFREYETSQKHLYEALECVIQANAAPAYQADICDLLAKLGMRSSPYAAKDSGYQRCATWIRDGLTRVPGNTQHRAVLLLRRAELEAWWGEWGKVEATLLEALPLSIDTQRNDLQAKGHFLRALTRQARSGSPKREDALAQAIAEVQEALVLLDNAQAVERSLFLCSLHLVLAALHGQRSEPWDHIAPHIQRARHYLETRLPPPDADPSAPASPDPDASYEAACLAAICGQLDEARKHLADAQAGSPGLGVRARHDFRLAPLYTGQPDPKPAEGT